jgi:glycosyltransferase involved in cell wall biosynthesis
MKENQSRAKDHEDARQRGLSAPQEERGAGSGPLVSVVIPCYNQAHFLSEAIESTLSQSYESFEIIVVDDGSTDNTSEVASRYPQQVRLIRQENRGLSGARNTGLAESEGEYVVFLDADDRLLPGALEVGVRELEAHPECAFVYGHVKLIATDGSLLKIPRQPYVEDHYATLLHYNYIRMPAMVMYRRAVFEVVGDFDTSVDATADWDLYLRIAREYPVHHHGEVVAEYRRQHGTNMTGNPAFMLKATVAVLRVQRKHIKGNKLYKQAYRTGLNKGQEYYGVPLADEVRTDVRRREWKRALRGVLVLLRYYPWGLTLLINERRKFALRLQNRKWELRARERQLQLYKRQLLALNGRPGNYERQVEELGSALTQEYQEVRRLRRSIERLELRIQELDRRRARNGRVSGTQKLLKRIGHLRAKAPWG